VVAQMLTMKQQTYLANHAVTNVRPALLTPTIVSTVPQTESMPRDVFARKDSMMTDTMLDVSNVITNVTLVTSTDVSLVPETELLLLKTVHVISPLDTMTPVKKNAHHVPTDVTRVTPMMDVSLVLETEKTFQLVVVHLDTITKKE
jgi:hypothetical protein